MVFVLVSMVSASLFVAVITHGFSQFREAQKIEEQLRAKAAKLDRKLDELANAEQSQDSIEWEQMMHDSELLLSDDPPDSASPIHSLSVPEHSSSAITNQALQFANQRLSPTPELPRAASQPVTPSKKGNNGTLPGSPGCLEGSSSGSGAGASGGTESATEQKTDQKAERGVEAREEAGGKPAEYWDTTDSENSEDEDSDQELLDSCWDATFPRRGDEKPTMACRLVFYDIVKHQYFDTFIVSMILLNVFSLATVYKGMSTTHENILNLSEWFFTVIFAVEALLKIVGLGPYPYFRRRTNGFDFILVVISLLGLVMSDATVSVLRMFRLVRTLRLIRVLRKSK